MPAPGLILVLDGGAGRRMGGADKALLRLDDTTRMIDLLLGRLRPLGVPIAISANGDPARFGGLGLPVLPDAAGGLGPLAGVLAGLEHVAGLDDAGWLLTVPGDTPFAPADLAERLAGAAATASRPCACAASGGRRHALVALWSVTLRHPLDDFLNGRGLRKVELFQREVGCAEADWSTDPGDPFLNINTPDDLAAARRGAAGLARGQALRIEKT